jgi:hypothetical protein
LSRSPTRSSRRHSPLADQEICKLNCGKRDNPVLAIDSWA